MDIIVKAKNCEVTSRLKEEAVEKIEHATRFFDRLLGVEVVFSSEQNPRIAEPALVEVTARTKGHLIRAEGVGEDHRDAVDAAVARFERQLSRYKARLVDRSRRHRPPAPSPSAGNGSFDVGAAEGDGSWPRPQIVRTKRFELHPMLPEDAAVQLELLGHDFFLFTNVATGHCNLLYRRKDGELGLIEAAD
ncbi:MAG TPA: ribosome-associated translation inhibitor RaiA [Egibacteraceae bacterium]|nr:ribosome-associated translation inhibitor RaiA [Egibacteraceae bacterium]